MATRRNPPIHPSNAHQARPTRALSIPLDPEPPIGERMEALDRDRVARWMGYNAGEHATSTELAEAAAEHFDVNDTGGPLDDPDHWIWELAREARELWESDHGGDDQGDKDNE